MTSLADFWSWLESLPLAGRIGESWWFPLLESIHVLSATFVLGTLLMVDLRLLGVAARQQLVTRISGELIPWSWGTFAVAVVTGIGSHGRCLARGWRDDQKRVLRGVME